MVMLHMISDQCPIVSPSFHFRISSTVLCGIKTSCHHAVPLCSPMLTSFNSSSSGLFSRHRYSSLHKARPHFVSPANDSSPLCYGRPIIDQKRGGPKSTRGKVTEVVGFCREKERKADVGVGGGAPCFSSREKRKSLVFISLFTLRVSVPRCPVRHVWLRRPRGVLQRQLRR